MIFINAHQSIQCQYNLFYFFKNITSNESNIQYSFKVTSILRNIFLGSTIIIFGIQPVLNSSFKWFEWVECTFKILSLICQIATSQLNYDHIQSFIIFDLTIWSLITILFIHSKTQMHESRIFSTHFLCKKKHQYHF